MYKRQAIEDTQSRAASHNRAIIHLESGGDPEDIDQGELQTNLFEPASSSIFAADESADESWVARARKSFARKADAQISIDVDDIELDSSPTQGRLSLSEKLPSLPAFMSASAVKSMASQNRSSLMAIGVVLAGVAIIAVSYTHLTLPTICSV